MEGDVRVSTRARVTARTEGAQVWLAARREQDFRRAIPRCTLGRVTATGQGTLEIPAWSVGFSSSHSIAYLQGHAD